MARWLLEGGHGVYMATQSLQVAVLLSTVAVFFACVAMLAGLCAAHSNPQVLNRESEPEGEAAMESKKHSQRFSGSEIKAKLNSFRKSSFRKSSSFRNSCSFRIDCNQIDVVDAFQKIQPVEEENTEPAVWQRSILRGERCAPLAFSGLILYDEKGNPLPLRNPPVQDMHINPYTVRTN